MSLQCPPAYVSITHGSCPTRPCTGPRPHTSPAVAHEIPLISTWGWSGSHPTAARPRWRSTFRCSAPRGHRVGDPTCHRCPRSPRWRHRRRPTRTIHCPYPDVGIRRIGCVGARLAAEPAGPVQPGVGRGRRCRPGGEEPAEGPRPEGQDAVEGDDGVAPELGRGHPPDALVGCRPARLWPRATSAVWCSGQSREEPAPWQRPSSTVVWSLTGPVPGACLTARRHTRGSMLGAQPPS